MNIIEKPNTKSERGITLVALIITIVILIILTSIAIKGITGEESLIKIAETSAEDYTVETYREQLIQISNEAILSYTIKGQEIRNGRTSRRNKERSDMDKDSRNHIKS